MAALANERVAYFNGKIVPESDVLIPFRDRGFMAGDAVFDTARTVRHRIFKLREHIDRLYSSLRYIQVDPRLSPKEMTAITEEVVARNLHLIDADDDYWVSQRISRGSDSADSKAGTGMTPTVIVECRPLPLTQRARLFRDGIDVIVPAVRRTAPDMLSPRAKTHNYLNLVMGDLEAKAADPEAWAVLLDANGNLCEGTGSNVFVVRGGTVMTPRERYVLPGISRATVIELAREIGQPCIEADIDLYDAYTADEAFLTSTSLCLCPVRSVNGRHVGVDAIPGPVTKRLMDAFARLMDFDFVAQYKRRLNG
ncbi:MAG TPA: aminotransferase class IV [Candidatus Acidoferrum sp.]|nr:aminotransferase class IV [Candidatus Acidoferrum sp.]